MWSWKNFQKYRAVTNNILPMMPTKLWQQLKNLLKDFGDEFISIELMLMGIIMGNDKAATILKNQGVTADKMKAAIP
jgi:ATP-dependent Clp protease ATP-binding subunit ClpB